ncbi:MgtC/SapB family protein [Aquibaculum arenosum]|uniref:Protein MgtC n=1 Tax=Aquibaculum arenosum TaxID=3032591 RepID=A0ABT5YHR6_9PROT|nr:MgtC/SapB family protein [Fodinicurvata sp. CAU 1616]MDF2094462.1 MgtC/SapB family protein [Fodinicurvata sp. CAU 1616]
MESSLLDVTSWPYLPLDTIAIRLLLAAMMGAVIGFEREWRRRPAGLRTHILVSLASALFSILTLEITHADIIQGDNIRVDPIRMIEAVTAGVAFLAAGAIIQSRGSVKGLTTGAGLWLAGAVGVACGLGLWSVGAIAMATGLIVMVLLGRLEQRFTKGREDPEDQ